MFLEGKSKELGHNNAGPAQKLEAFSSSKHAADKDSVNVLQYYTVRTPTIDASKFELIKGH